MKIRRAISLIALFVACGAASSIGQVEVEPNNTQAQANPLVRMPAINSGTLSATADVDFYVLNLEHDSQINVRMFNGSVGTCNSTIDGVLSIFDASGTILASNDDTFMLCPALSSQSIPQIETLTAGTYYIAANSLFSQAGAAYVLTVEVRSAPTPLTETLTYQGRLVENGAPVTGNKEMVFSLWGHPSDTDVANRLSLPILYSYVDVVDGLFTVDLDFTLTGAPANFDGKERFLQIEVGDADSNNRVTLDGRQRLTAAPYATYASNSNKAKEAAKALTATTAQHAETATNATYATFASEAAGVIWQDIDYMPAGFADGTDDAGPFQRVGNSSVHSCPTGTSIGIGTTNIPAGSVLAVNGNAAKVGGGSWAVFCDPRLKHDIKPLEGTLDRLLQLRGYSFVYNTEAVKQERGLPGTQLGLMADEVQQVFPDWVTEDRDGYRYVTERATTALMVEGLRDLRAEKDAGDAALREQLSKMEAENAELKAKIAEIEKAVAKLKAQ